MTEKSQKGAGGDGHNDLTLGQPTSFWIEETHKQMSTLQRGGQILSNGD
jgi:hypothetical protein